MNKGIGSKISVEVDAIQSENVNIYAPIWFAQVQSIHGINCHGITY